MPGEVGRVPVWEEVVRHIPALAVRTVLLYGLVLATMRWTGKRTVTAMAPFDLALVIMISEVAAIPITELDVDLAHGLVPVLLLGALHVLVTTLNLHNKRIEEFTEGRPTLLVKGGRLLIPNLRRERVSLGDLSAALRMHQVSHLDQVEEAWLEPGGGVSVILKPVDRPLSARDLQEFLAADRATLSRLNLSRLQRQLEALQQQRPGVDPTAISLPRPSHRERTWPAGEQEAAPAPVQGLVPGMEAYVEHLGGPGEAPGRASNGSPRQEL